MTINLIIGRQGSGKTLLLVKLAYDNYKQQLKRKIYANFKLNIPFNRIDYDDIINCRLIDCMTLLDEVHLILPARLSMRGVNIEICDNFLSMARKQNNNIYATTQTLRKVDVRFREEADFIYYCTKYAYINGSWVEIIHDAMLPQQNVKTMIGVQIEETYSGDVINTAFMGNQYYDKFNTKEIVKITGLLEAMQRKKKKTKN